MSLRIRLFNFDKLSKYKVFTEVPITTSGGFMKADVFLIKKREQKIIYIRVLGVIVESKVCLMLSCCSFDGIARMFEITN